MSGSNCICFRCKRPLIETDSYGQLLWGCVNCKLWWLARGPVRSHSSQEQLRALNLNPPGTPDVDTGESGSAAELGTLAGGHFIGCRKGKPRLSPWPGFLGKKVCATQYEKKPRTVSARASSIFEMERMMMAGDHHHSPFYHSKLIYQPFGLIV